MSRQEVDTRSLLDTTLMAMYDSDSSDENDAYTITNTLLGYASKEPTDDSISQLGGLPVCFYLLLLNPHHDMILIMRADLA